jgi:hypothetical protein
MRALAAAALATLVLGGCRHGEQEWTHVEAEALGTSCDDGSCAIVFAFVASRSELTAWEDRDCLVEVTFSWPESAPDVYPHEHLGLSEPVTVSLEEWSGHTTGAFDLVMTPTAGQSTEPTWLAVDADLCHPSTAARLWLTVHDPGTPEAWVQLLDGRPGDDDDSSWD